eukprot:CAMPEP_0194673916 /NCGR_PEP_ID=MMETSP0295-20121207/7338_1 /TAXON_ID=39354 /ORGANISM="Heterosigma akashiwo, Strain CCMP2393" /LENGTH=133 /DNA_ID=CAMNT_0039557933 /DNA_START=161 /DNA_END=559 /DNA_ORIENTATION=+
MLFSWLLFVSTICESFFHSGSSSTPSSVAFIGQNQGKKSLNSSIGKKRRFPFDLKAKKNGSRHTNRAAVHKPQSAWAKIMRNFATRSHSTETSIESAGVGPSGNGSQVDDLPRESEHLRLHAAAAAAAAEEAR